MNRLLAALSLSVSLAALAEDPLPPVSIPDPMANSERLFPQGVSPVTNNTLVYSNTSGRGTSNDGSNAFRLSERVDLALLQRLTISVGAEYRSNGDLNPEVTAKYQLLDQAAMGINLAAALKYKLVGLNPNGSELEGVIAASRSIGPVVVMLNGVVGRGLVEPDMDLEAVVGIGTRFLSGGFVGLNGQAKFLIGEPAEEIEALGGRPSEYLGGLVVAYRFSPMVEASILGGFLSPTGTTPAGPMGLAKLGLAF